MQPCWTYLSVTMCKLFICRSLLGQMHDVHDEWFHSKYPFYSAYPWHWKSERQQQTSAKVGPFDPRKVPSNPSVTRARSLRVLSLHHCMTPLFEVASHLDLELMSMGRILQRANEYGCTLSLPRMIPARPKKTWPSFGHDNDGHQSTLIISPALLLVGDCPTCCWYAWQ